MRSFLAAVLAVLSLSAPALCCSVMRIPPLPVLEAQMAEMRERIAADSADHDAWETLVRSLEMTGYHRTMELDQGSEDDEELALAARENLRAEVQQVIDEWIASVPDEPKPYLARSARLTDPQAREEALREMTAILGDAYEGFEALARHLADTDRPGESTEVLKGFLAGHPDDADAYRILVDHYQGLDDADAAVAVGRRWLERFPDLPGALSWNLAAGLLSFDELAVTVKRLRKTAEPAVLLEICGLLAPGSKGQLPAAAAECARQVADQSDDPGAAYEAQDALYRFLPAAGDWDGVLRLLAADEDHARADGQRPFLALQAAKDSACPAALEMIREPLPPPSWPPSRLEVASALSLCGEDTQAREVAAEFAMEAPTAFFYDTRLENMLGVDALVAILERRLETALDDNRLFGHLSRLLEKSGRVEERISLLMTWSDVAPEDVTPPLQAAGLYEKLGQPDSARSFYEEALRRDPSRAPLYGRIFRTFLAAGKTEEARELAEGLRQSDEPARHWLGLGMLAKIALDEERVEEAIENLEALQETDLREVPYEVLELYQEALREAGLAVEAQAFHDRRIDFSF